MTTRIDRYAVRVGRAASWLVVVAVGIIFVAGAQQGRIPWLGAGVACIGMLAAWVNGRWSA